MITGGAMRWLVRVVSWCLLATVPAHAAECERASSAGLDFIVCRADVSRERVEIAYAGEDGRPFGNFEALRRAYAARGLTLTFAMNAGMFHPDFRPVGLLVIDGQSLAPINR